MSETTQKAISVRYYGEGGNPHVFFVGQNCDEIRIESQTPEPYCVHEYVVVLRGGEPVFKSALHKVEHVFFQDPENGDDPDRI